MITHRVYIFAALVWLGCWGPIDAAPAQGDPPPAQAGALRESKVIATLSPQLMMSEGGNFWLLVNFNIDTGWHLYWKNPGASGKAPAVKVTMPEGWSTGELLFPRPSVLRTADGINYGYEGTLTLLQRVIPPATGDSAAAPLGPISLTADVSWLVCKDVCRAGSASLTATVSPPPPGGLGISATYPVALTPGSASIEMRDGIPILRATVPQAGPGKVTFVPDACPGIDFLGAEPHMMPITNGSATLSLPLKVTLGDSPGSHPRVRGLILMGESRGEPSFFIDLPVPDRGAEPR